MVSAFYKLFLWTVNYSARISPETTHKLMGFCMEVLILGVILQSMVYVAVSYRVYRINPLYGDDHYRCHGTVLEHLQNRNLNSAHTPD